MTAAPKAIDEKRYDRQLRLWGEDGQRRLGGARLCLLNANATGTETLKNLVLPGIGAFTIVDGTKVDAADLNNFFIEESSLGQSRAEVTTRLLNELNSEVEGKAVARDPVEIIDKEISFFHQFTLIIASGVPEESLLKLAREVFPRNIPVVVIRSYGLVGTVRVATAEHTIIESKQDNPPDDLRLLTPFPELIQFSDSLDLDSMNSTDHSHTPFVVILLKNFKRWANEHGGKYPGTYAEKQEFRAQVIKGQKKSDEGNFDEAFKAALKSCAVVEIPSEVKALFGSPKAANITKDSADFWVLVRALKDFVDAEGEGLLPVSGGIPDMTATTEFYIQIQKIYQQKAADHAAAVSKRVKATLQAVGKPEDSISEDDIKKFCKHAAFLNCLNYRSLDDERHPSTAKSSLIASEIADENSHMNWFVALRAADRFYTAHGRYPGNEDKQIEGDLPVLKKITEDMLREIHVATDLDERFLGEIIRFGNSELHPIASLIGGVASQEVIKLVTHQYVPLNNTFIFNGLNSSSRTYQL